MSNPLQTLSYSSPIIGHCPLCNIRPLSKKSIYGHPVCKKCFYSFANRRQLDYLIDSLLFALPSFGVMYAAQFALIRTGLTDMGMVIVSAFIGLAMACILCCRDGFNGQSPGKRMTGLIVLNEANYQPISFGQSFKRNSILLLASIPVAGGFIGLILIIIIAVQVGSGYRLGDRFAKTKVIWKKYAHLPVFGGTTTACRGCGYDLRGNVSGICPECGTSVPAKLQERLIAAP